MPLRCKPGDLAMVHAVPGWFTSVPSHQRIRPVVPMGTMVSVVHIIEGDLWRLAEPYHTRCPMPSGWEFNGQVIAISDSCLTPYRPKDEPEVEDVGAGRGREEGTPQGNQARFERAREGIEPAACERAAGRGTNGALALATLPRYSSPDGGPMGAGYPAAAGPTSCLRLLLDPTHGAVLARQSDLSGFLMSGTAVPGPSVGGFTRSHRAVAYRVR